MQKARTCFTCKKYVLVQQTFLAQMREQDFDSDHAHHPVATVDINEITDYTNVNAFYNRKVISPHNRYEPYEPKPTNPEQ